VLEAFLHGRIFYKYLTKVLKGNIKANYVLVRHSYAFRAGLPDRASPAAR
jgi:membrane protein CcdC involved in cytochrome C biogenesis